MLIGSTNSFTPCDSNTWSPAPCPFSSIIRPYWKPEQPPPCTNTRRPLPALFSSVSNSLILPAAVSETLIMIGISPQESLSLYRMPLRAVPRPNSHELHEISTRRWDDLRAARPDLVPAVDLQQNLLGIVVAAAEAIEGRLPRLSLPPKYLDAKLKRGVPILIGEPIPLPLQVLKSAFLKLCETLAQGGAGEAAEHIQTSVVDGKMEAGSLLTASLSRNQDAIRQGAVHRGLAPDLVWLLAELATSPFAHALQRALLPLDAEWNHGFCACCGSWPALMEVVDGHRILRC